VRKSQGCKSTFSHCKVLLVLDCTVIGFVCSLSWSHLDHFEPTRSISFRNHSAAPSPIFQLTSNLPNPNSLPQSMIARAARARYEWNGSGYSSGSFPKPPIGDWADKRNERLGGSFIRTLWPSICILVF
jgi:hypothetical protein